jgi:hypothetical protein
MDVRTRRHAVVAATTRDVLDFEDSEELDEDFDRHDFELEAAEIDRGTEVYQQFIDRATALGHGNHPVVLRARAIVPAAKALSDVLLDFAYTYHKRRAFAEQLRAAREPFLRLVYRDQQARNWEAANGYTEEWMRLLPAALVK